MSKDYIINALSMCSSNIEYVNRTIHTSVERDLLANTVQILDLLISVIDSHTIDN